MRETLSLVPELVQDTTPEGLQRLEAEFGIDITAILQEQAQIQESSPLTTMPLTVLWTKFIWLTLITRTFCPDLLVLTSI